MTLVVCTPECWACKFDLHPHQPHTYLSIEDSEFNMETSESAVEKYPCGCVCSFGEVL
jgi:hypothetical protein